MKTCEKEEKGGGKKKEKRGKREKEKCVSPIRSATRKDQKKRYETR